ncbi:beta-aspartyl-peptidase [Bacillus sp. EB01]|uniref:beta-aspartyl-peptidase n=1 Tax=Bacillus sp. EB01 TaxID=1347086 RepID=UPI0005C58A7A|nr:beta-aspartyl-peptidase [Bacillus sp. EB01]
MLTLIKNGLVYAPDFLGKKDILVVRDKIGFIDEEIAVPEGFVEIDVVDAAGKYIFPGFIDSHVHIMGAGGEGGFRLRTPELMVTDATVAGITTVVGVIGDDSTTRSMASLLGKANALEEEGLSTYIHTGSYQVPVRTLMGKIEDDIILVAKIIGVGEIAIADERSSQPTVEDISKIAAAAMTGGKMIGKAGILNIHVGTGPDKLSLINQVIDKTNIPITQFQVTHVNRNRELFEEAKDYARKGGYIDFTTSTDYKSLKTTEIKCSKGLKEVVDEGVPLENVTFTSDGMISLPTYDEEGNQNGYKLGLQKYLYEEVKDAILEEDVPIEKALRVITANPADILQLKTKGYIEKGRDADLVIVDPHTLEIQDVFAKGRKMMEKGKPIVFSTFERERMNKKF